MADKGIALANDFGGNSTVDPGFEFAVFVIESPRSDDAYFQRSEISAISLVGQLDGIPVGGRIALDREHFERALSEAVPAFILERTTPYIFCLHLGAHGDESGFQLSSGEVVSWHDLRKLLIPVCKMTAGLFMLSMSSCKGLHAYKSAMTLWGDDDLPFMLHIGSSGSPNWAETTLGYATLYHHLRTGSSVEKGVEAMRAASRHEEFDFAPAKLVQEIYRESLQAYAKDLWKSAAAAGDLQAGLRPQEAPSEPAR